MEVHATTAGARDCSAELRAQGRGLGFVPTMGALHEGHMTLVRQASSAGTPVAASIFVNPAQFDRPEDLKNYPRTLERDLDLLKEAGVALVYTPGPSEVYPPGFQTWVEVMDLAKPLCGAKRPGHFRGVATVVTKLFNVIQPTRAYFGEKDLQQVLLIRRMTRDLDLPVEIVTAPTVREPDGLAMSSRNVRLTSQGRQRAVVLSKSLFFARDRVKSGIVDWNVLRQEMEAMIRAVFSVTIDYLELFETEGLTSIQRVKPPCAIALAAYVDGVRLIDNMPFWK